MFSQMLRNGYIQRQSYVFTVILESKSRRDLVFPLSFPMSNVVLMVVGGVCCIILFLFKTCGCLPL